MFPSFNLSIFTEEDGTKKEFQRTKNTKMYYLKRSKDKSRFFKNCTSDI